jgi:predicted exporter
MADPIQQALERLAEAERLVAEARILLSGASGTELAETVSTQVFQDPVAGLFQLAISPPEEEQELREALRQLLHPEIGGNDRAMDSLLRFNWARFMRQYPDYLSNPADPASYQVSGEQTRVLADHRERKLFLSAAGRNPAPISLRSPAEDGGTWRICSFSL